MGVYNFSITFQTELFTLHKESIAIVMNVMYVSEHDNSKKTFLIELKFGEYIA